MHLILILNIINTSSSTTTGSRHRLLNAALLLLLLRFRVADSLVDREDRASCLCCSLEGVLLHKKGLPDERVLVVSNALVDVDTLVDIFGSSLVWVTLNVRCLFLSLLMRSSESSPALSAMVLGMISMALANMFITNCSLPEI
jgi:hypothetical protein